MKKVFTFLCLFAVMNLFAQRTITGTVTDEKGETIIGAAVRILGTTLGTTTDTEGRYALEVGEKDAFLSFSFAGMKSMDVKIESTQTLNAVLKTTTLPEFVKIGYGRTTGWCCGLRVVIIYTPRGVFSTQTEQSTFSFNVLGNPFKDRFLLNIKSEEETKAIVSLHNIEGKTVHSFETNLSKGDNRLEMDNLSHLVSGTYTVSVNLVEQNAAPKITDKVTLLNLPTRFYGKLMSAYPAVNTSKNKEVIPLSKQQYELVFEASTLKENFNKVMKNILAVNPGFDSWDLDDASISEDDEILYLTYKEQLTQFQKEYQSIMTNPFFKSKNDERDYTLEDLVDDEKVDYYNILLVKRDIVVKQKVYTQLVIKME